MASYTIYNSPGLFHYPPLTLEDEHSAYQEVLRYQEARVTALQKLEDIRTLLASPTISAHMRQSLLPRELATQHEAKLVSDTHGVIQLGRGATHRGHIRLQALIYGGIVNPSLVSSRLTIWISP